MMTPGDRLGPYEIVGKLGAGGMGEVYRARDSKLNRDVAIKVLPAAFSSDAQYMARFEREAQVLASLNHPNIATVYGIEQRALVMELVEGADLAGPIAMEEAIPIARQIALGLEAAHERGIVHRDLKPANIKITPAGVVKILDFGLAKVAGEATAASAAVSQTMSPTMSLAMTQAGMILGTAAYMSPEQARGKPVDKRADVWAFGVVLYEMLTGRQLFGGGETVTDTLASVVKDAPDLTALPPGTPPYLRALLERCLRKDVNTRLRDIGEARIVLENPPAAVAELPASPAPRSAVRWSLVAAAAIVSVSGAFWAGWRMAHPAAAALVRLNVELAADAIPGRHTSAILSPDGERVVFPVRLDDGTTQLATRLLNDGKTVRLTGTESGVDPFLSPDGHWIGFFASGKLKKVAVQGGATYTLCDASNPRGGSWLADGTIVFTPNTTSPLLRVKDSGGTPQPITDLAKANQRTHRWPYALPGGRSLLYTSHVTSTQFDDAEIYALDLPSGKSKLILRGGFFGRYVPTGHLLYANRGTMFAIRFDLARLETSGTPVSLADDLAVNAISAAGEFDFSAAAPGILAYLPGNAQDLTFPLQWMNSAGQTEVLLPGPRVYTSPKLSPDGRLLAVSVGLTTSSDLHVLDIGRGTFSQLTFNAQSNMNPVWAPDGKHLVFSSKPDNHHILWWIRADGAGQPHKLLESADTIYAGSFSPDGRRLAYMDIASGTGGDLWTLPLDLKDPENPQPGKPELFLQTPKAESSPTFSPDGKWMAYASDDLGRNEVYVRPFPGPGGKWLISAEGGEHPVWLPTGHQFFYETTAGRLMVVDYEAHGDSFVAGKRRPWAESRRLITGTGRNYDLAPDGKRIVGSVSEEKETAVQAKVTFLMNFFDELKRRLP